MKNIFNPGTIKTFYGLMAVILLVIQVVCITWMTKSDSTSELLISGGISVGLLVFIVFKVFKFLTDNTGVIRISDVVPNQTEVLRNSFQSVELFNLVSSLEQLKRTFIQNENWDALQKLDSVLVTLRELEENTGTHKPSRINIADPQLELNRANRQLADLLTQIRK